MFRSFSEKKKDKDNELTSLHTDAHPDGGLSCNNEELLKEQRQAIMTWLKSMGKRILSGSLNLISTPFPVNMFEPRSYLEKLADVWVYPKYLEEASSTSNPLQRMQLVLTWFIAGLHLAFVTWKKPFNPILGETWQAELSDGTKIFMEQTSHHPPVSCWVMEGPGNKYQFVGLSQPLVSILLKNNGFQTVAKGYRYIEFADGSKIEVHYPRYVIKGVVSSSKPRAELEGEAQLIDRKNKLFAKIRFGSVKGSKSTLLKRTDAVTGAIYPIVDMSVVRTMFPEEACGSEEFDMPGDGERTPNAGDDFDEDALTMDRNANTSTPESNTPPESESILSFGTWARSLNNMFRSQEGAGLGPPLSTIEGSWLSHIEIDGNRTWSLKDDAPDKWVAVANPLPSDCRYRQDLDHLRRGDLEGAHFWKEELQDLQRADKKLRGV